LLFVTLPKIADQVKHNGQLTLTLQTHIPGNKRSS